MIILLWLLAIFFGPYLIYCTLHDQKEQTITEALLLDRPQPPSDDDFDEIMTQEEYAKLKGAKP